MSARPLSLRDVACALPPVRIARCVVDALVAEARLTPKPALVDARGSRAHRDLDLDTMLRSADALEPAFLAMAHAASDAPPSQALREQLARIGREGERAMMRATAGSNAHRGAIWIVGLLCARAAMNAPGDSEAICASAADIACFEDRFAPVAAAQSHGAKVSERFHVAGARGEARDGFPHALRIGLPALRNARARGLAEHDARLDDTCLLHRGGLHTAQHGARRVIDAGGMAHEAGRAALVRLDRDLLALIAAIEPAFQSGSTGEVSGAKIAAALEMALTEFEAGRTIRPVILFETGGVRLQEANLGLAVIAEIQAAIVALRRHVPGVDVIGGMVGCFGSMSLAATLCTELVMTRQARLGMNGPEVIEQEAGIEELDSHDRRLA
ncbi:Malonate decarboxylase beta subunit [Candidatus Burkholderia humilis]|nr:Malonate decarboxylase beta subunit [Candidatus Burkholderia humilis]